MNVPQRRLALAVLTLALLPPGLASAQPKTPYLEHPRPEQPFIEQIAPPVFRRGETRRVQFLGTRLQQATHVWSSLAAAHLTAKPVSASTPERAEFDITVAADAPLGICGLRVATEGGLSNVHLALIEELPLEEVPVAKTDVAPLHPTKLPLCLTGLCREDGLERFEISVAAGETVSFEVVGNRFGKDYDPLLVVRDPLGRIVTEHDNDPGLFFDLRFAHRFEQAGRYVVELRDARFEGDPSWHFALRMGTFRPVQIAIPAVSPLGDDATLRFPQDLDLKHRSVKAIDRLAELRMIEIKAPRDAAGVWLPTLVSDLPVTVEAAFANPAARSPAATAENSEPEPTPATVPGLLCGVLAKPGEADLFAFELKAGERIDVRGLTRTLGSAADLELQLLGPDGREVKRVDDVGLDEGSFTHTANKAGAHKLVVSDVTRGGGPAHAYVVEVRGGGPTLQLASDFSAVSLPQANWQPLPLKATRNGFQGEIALRLEGAPTGVTLEPATIPAGTDEMVCRLVATPQAPRGIFSVRLIGTAEAPAAKMGETPISVTTLARTQPMVDRQLKNVDRIPYALRDDQRLLPPALTDRIALCVVAAAPFSFDLPEPTLVMTRYQTVSFPLVTTRPAATHTAPIAFRSEGGQIGDEREERNQVFFRSPTATPSQGTVSGVFHNRILTQLMTHRVDLYAMAEHAGHNVTLIRTCTMEIKSAFAPSFESPVVTGEAGETVRAVLLANRLPSWSGAIEIESQNPPAGWGVPMSLRIPADAVAQELSITIPPEAKPGRTQVRFAASAFVGKYEENVNVPALTIEVKKPAGTK